MTVIKLKIILKIILVLPLCMPAQHQIKSYVIGGGATSSSTNSSQIKGTIGQPLIGSSGNEINSGFWIQLNEITTDVEEIQSDEVPTEYNLYQNYPNPFNPATTIKYSIPIRQLTERYEYKDVRLVVYDILGREVATLINEKQKPGNYKIEWNAANSSSGIYLYKLSAGDFTYSRKMILLK
jgi:hypothetical protein